MTLGLNVVPVTIEKVVDGKIGSIQYFIKDAQEGGVKSPELRLLDYLISNTDRHEGNYLTAAGNRIVGIDHGISFGIFGGNRYLSEMLEMIPSEQVFDAIKKTTRAQWEKELRPKLREAYNLIKNSADEVRTYDLIVKYLKKRNEDTAFEKFTKFVDTEIEMYGRKKVFTR